MNDQKHGTVVPRSRKVAQKHIARHGLDEFELRKIAREAKTSTSQLYKYFKNKDGLIADVFSEGWKLLDDQIHSRLKEIYSNDFDPKETVRAIISSVFDTFEKHHNAISATILLGYMVSPPLRDVMKNTQGFIRYEILVKRFAETCKAEISDEEVKVITQVIFATLMRLLYTLTPYYNNGWLTKAEMQENRVLLENVLFKLVEGTIIVKTAQNSRK